MYRRILEWFFEDNYYLPVNIEKKVYIENEMNLFMPKRQQSERYENISKLMGL
jgi:hypothetical protein